MPVLPPQTTGTGRRSKRWLLGFLLLLWTLPAVQAGLNMKVFRPSLRGFEVQRPWPLFSWQGMLATSYPDSLERYAIQKIGFREWLAQPRNQLKYSLFNETSNAEVRLGENGFLYEEGPLAGYLARAPLVPATDAAAHVARLRAVQDSLARRGKLLVFAIAPNKASVYPEYLPDSLRRRGPTATNYDQYAQLMQAAGINLLNFGPLFRQWKVHSPYLLFPPGGTHWSGYGFVRAADTLFRFMEQRGRFRLPTIRQTGLETSTTPRYTDDDLLRLLNLLHNPAPPPLAYPTLAFEPLRPGQQKPRLLLIGDSFGWSFIEFYPYLQHFFAPESHFRYYNREVAWPLNPSPIDAATQLDTHDVVLVLFTEHNLANFDQGFSDEALRQLTKGN